MKPQNLIHILIGIVCIGLLPRAQAVVPTPDGGYPGCTTAEGTKALFSLATGSVNTAVGWLSLFNTATGAVTLLLKPQTKTRRLALTRFYSIRPAPTTQPLEQQPF